MYLFVFPVSYDPGISIGGDTKSDTFILLSGIIVLSNIAFQQRVWCGSPQGLSDTVWKTFMEIASQDVKVRKPQWGIGFNLVNLAFLKPSVKVEKTLCGFLFFFFSHNNC